MSHLAKSVDVDPFLPSPSSQPAILDWFKPSPHEALARLRSNSLGLLTLTILTNLLPLPSPWDAISALRRNTTSTPYYILCALEVLVLALLALNVLQASYAIKYPRVSHSPHPPTPAKPSPMATPVRQWRLNGLSPNSSPQRQKSFSYVPSPVSTPSRTLNYTIPPTTTTPDASFASSAPSVPATPASPLAAYRGRHSTHIGRAFDGSLLNRLTHEVSDDED
ncbi:hypothetical protein B0H21DRAFT_541805 [Amylocystis lapponica]|nr:hypothetical protein B0H21DRAFT_541805 [Amylocystis lapponica]